MYNRTLPKQTKKTALKNNKTNQENRTPGETAGGNKQEAIHPNVHPDKHFVGKEEPGRSDSEDSTSFLLAGRMSFELRAFSVVPNYGTRSFPLYKGTSTKNFLH